MYMFLMVKFFCVFLFSSSTFFCSVEKQIEKSPYDSELNLGAEINIFPTVEGDIAKLKKIMVILDLQFPRPSSSVESQASSNELLEREDDFYGYDLKTGKYLLGEEISTEYKQISFVNECYKVD